MSDYNLPAEGGIASKEAHDAEVNRAISEAEARAKARANHTGMQGIGTVDGLQEALDGKATAAQGALADTALQSGAPVTAIQGLQFALDNIDAGLIAAATKDEAALAGAPEAWRAGDTRVLFTSALTGGAAARPVIAAGTEVNSALLGRALRIGASDVPGDPGYLNVASRRVFAVEPGRVYRLRVALARSTDPADPEGNGIELRLQNLNNNKAHVSNVRLGDVLSPLVADGRVLVEVLISRDVEGVDYAPPATTRYVTPHLRVHGNGQATDIELIDWHDVTEIHQLDVETSAALALKAPLESPAFTGTPTGITKHHVGLGAVANIAPDAMPLSGPQAAALADLQVQIEALSSGAQIVGDWDAGSGDFPTTRPDSSAIQAGDVFLVAGAGTVDGVEFAVADRLVALVAGGGATYAGTWLRAAYSDLLDDFMSRRELGLEIVGGVGANDYGSLLVDAIKRQVLERLYRGRTVLQATDLVTLDFGDDPANDNTAALMELAERPTAGVEIIEFPEGVLYHHPITIGAGVRWIGVGATKTLFKLRPTDFNEFLPVMTVGQIKLNRAVGCALWNVEFDTQHDAGLHTYPESGGQYECIEIDNRTHGHTLVDVIGGNCRQDAFDSDRCHNGLFIDCFIPSAGKDGYHNSTDTYGNIYIRCSGTQCGGTRGVFTQSQNSLGGNMYILCAGWGSTRGFDIRVDKNGLASGLVLGCASYDNDNPDNLSGVASGAADAKGLFAAIAAVAAMTMGRGGEGDVATSWRNSQASEGYTILQGGEVRQWRTVDIDAGNGSTMTFDFPFNLEQDARVTINGTSFSGSFSPTGGSGVSNRAAAFASLAYAANNNQVQLRVTNPQAGSNLRLLITMQGRLKPGAE